MSSNESHYSIAQTVRTQAREIGGAIVFSFKGEEITYADFDKASNRVANGLLDLGVKKGDRIAFLGTNSPRYFELIAAVSKIGAVMTALNWRLTAAEVTYVLNDCQAKLVFAGKEFCELVQGILPLLTECSAMYAVDGDIDNVPSYDLWSQQFSNVDPMLNISPDTDVVQLYTSGTTGKPKGVVLTDRNILASRGQEEGDDMDAWQLYERGETALLAMPCFHVGGTAFGLGVIHSGAHAVVLSGFDPGESLALIERYSIGKVFMVPSALQMFLKHSDFEATDLTSLNYIFYGASPIPLELMREAVERIGCGFVQMYGMTETAGTIVALPPADHDTSGGRKMRSVGKALWGIELKIIDDSGHNVATGCIGEIATRSAKNMGSYWQLQEATKDTIDKEGWLRTGDAGYMDAEGYLYIHDRVKDMIISGGENIYPAEVENALYSHPSIDDVAVIGVPDSKWGEAVKAFVVVKHGAEVNHEEVIEFTKTQIASYKCPKTIEVIDELPRNPSGKILRRELRQAFWQGKSHGVN